MQYFFDNLIIDINGLISNMDDRKREIIKKSFINLMISSEKNNFKIFLFSSFKDARTTIINEIAEDIEDRVSVQIFDEDNYNNGWDVWRIEHNLNKKNSILILTSEIFLGLLTSDDLFSMFINATTFDEEDKKICKKTTYKKNVNISSLIEEIPNILFKFDSFLEEE